LASARGTFSLRGEVPGIEIGLEVRAVDMLDEAEERIDRTDDFANSRLHDNRAVVRGGNVGASPAGAHKRAPYLVPVKVVGDADPAAVGEAVGFAQLIRFLLQVFDWRRIAGEVQGPSTEQLRDFGAPLEAIKRGGLRRRV